MTGSNTTDQHLAYSLKDGEVVSRIATDEEVKAASHEASAKLNKDGSDWAMRSCWVCNPAHSHFLNDLDDGSFSDASWDVATGISKALT